MAFDTGVNQNEAQKIGLSEGYYLVRDERLWIPVEVTLFGKPFHEAWRTAMEECLRLEEEGQLHIVDTREAWKVYPPSPPHFGTRDIAAPEKPQQASLWAADWETLGVVRESFLQQEYLAELTADPADHALRSAFVYNLLHLGAYDRALAQLDILENQEAPLQMVENNPRYRLHPAGRTGKGR